MTKAVETKVESEIKNLKTKVGLEIKNLETKVESEIKNINNDHSLIYVYNYII